jgi:hypothetical protein
VKTEGRMMRPQQLCAPLPRLVFQLVILTTIYHYLNLEVMKTGIRSSALRSSKNCASFMTNVDSSVITLSLQLFSVLNIS